MKLPYRINKKQNNLLVYVIVGVIMLVLAIVCLFSPFIPLFKNAFNDTMNKIYMIIGSVCTPFFTFYTCYNLLNLISPPAGIVIKQNGFYERTMADGCVGFIPVDAIVSLKSFGNKSKKYLGIKIDPDYIDQLGDSKKAKRELISNMESGMPAIIIKESDIAISVSELLKILLEVYNSSNSPGIVENPTKINNNDDQSIIALPDDEETQNLEPDFTDVISIAQEAEDTERPTLALNNEEGDEPFIITESEKPRITSVDELLSHLMISNKKDNVDNEQDKQ